MGWIKNHILWAFLKTWPKFRRMSYYISFEVVVWPSKTKQIPNVETTWITNEILFWLQDPDWSIFWQIRKKSWNHSHNTKFPLSRYFHISNKVFHSVFFSGFQVLQTKLGWHGQPWTRTPLSAYVRAYTVLAELASKRRSENLAKWFWQYPQ